MVRLGRSGFLWKTGGATAGVVTEETQDEHFPEKPFVAEVRGQREVGSDRDTAVTLCERTEVCVGTTAQ